MTCIHYFSSFAGRGPTIRCPSPPSLRSGGPPSRGISGRHAKASFPLYCTISFNSYVTGHRALFIRNFLGCHMCFRGGSNLQNMSQNWRKMAKKSNFRLGGACGDQRRGVHTQCIFDVSGSKSALTAHRCSPLCLSPLLSESHAWLVN